MESKIIAVRWKSCPVRISPAAGGRLGHLIDLGKHGLGGLEQNAGILHPELRNVIDRSKAVSELYSIGVQVAKGEKIFSSRFVLP